MGSSDRAGPEADAARDTARAVRGGVGAFVDATIWEVGWLTHPIVARLLKRTHFFPNRG